MTWLIEERKPGVPHNLINKCAYSVQESGPRRVLIDKEGLGCPPRRANEMGISWDIILVRDDGWSLGTNCELFEVAFSLWSESWIAVLIKETPLQGNVSISTGDAHLLVAGCLSQYTNGFTE